MKNPYSIIKSLYVTEKTQMLQRLQHSTSNRSVAVCNSPKYTFIVDKKANKVEIANAIEQIYSELNVKVVAVNTMHTKPKQRRMRKGRPGQTSALKKAIVTLEAGDSLEA